jgi:DNA-binding transcriptional ArsR family regulator
MTLGNIDVHERIDMSYRLLADVRRRRVLYALEANDAIAVDRLAAALVRSGLAENRERAAASLVHTHLPKLADAGVIEYEREAGIVAADDGAACLEPFLDRAREVEPDAERWSNPAPCPASSRSPTDD